MSITVEISIAEQRFRELLAQAEAGEEIIIARGETPLIKITKVERDPDVQRAIEEIRAARRGLPTTTIEEILQWRDEGRR